MKPPGPEGTFRIDVSREELEALLEGVRPALGEAGYQKLQAAIRTLNYVTELLETREATLERLRRLLCHSSTEKTGKVLKPKAEPMGREHKLARRFLSDHAKGAVANYEERWEGWDELS